MEKRRADDSRRQAKHRLAKKVGGVKEARRDEKAKATIAKKAAVKDAKEKEQRRLAERINTAYERMHDKAKSDIQDTLDKLKAQVARSRKRARTVEGAAQLSGKRLRRAQQAETKLKELKQQLDEVEELQADMDRTDEADETDEAVAGKEGRGKGLKRTAARRDARGRLMPMSMRLRVLIWSQLARRVVPSAVARNIHEVVAAYAAEGCDEPMPTERQIGKMRGELAIAGEAIAALRIARAIRIISFGLDESTKYGLGLLSTNVQIEPDDAPGTSADVVPRGACLIAGGKAQQVASAVESKIFSHARWLLIRWREVHEKRFGKDSWVRDGGPDPERIGLHRLADHTTLMSDTCNAARACKRLLAEMCMEAAKVKAGITTQQWDAMSEVERDSKMAVYLGDCGGHLRNIVINAMSLKASEFLKTQLRDDLDEFSAFDRMSVDGMDFIRAVFKELHGGGQYAKGKGREFTAWRKKHHPDAFFMPFENAPGTRQDMNLDGMAPFFANRKLVIEFLHQLVNAPGASDNQLETFLWRLLKCNEMTALTRVCTLFKYIISEPMRWLTGKASKSLEGWSQKNSSEMFDALETALVAIAADGHSLFDPQLDPFSSIAAAQQSFAKFQADMRVHPMHARVFAEACSPASSKGSVQATEKAVELAECMANAALQAMRDPRRAIADKLTSQEGVNAAGKLDSVHEKAAGAHQMNDHVESNFGCFDLVAHMFRYTKALLLRTSQV